MSGLFYLCQDIAKNFKKGQFARKLKNGPDIYEHIRLSKVYTRRTNDEAVCLAVLFFLFITDAY